MTIWFNTPPQKHFQFLVGIDDISISIIAPAQTDAIFEAMYFRNSTARTETKTVLSDVSALPEPFAEFSPRQVSPMMTEIG
ncbi:hypothetical protein [Magnetospirillum sulfuroxidans]|uniref:Uncharacterized protein n=1 Tax=Magnetospirillum sulfuroxidans TaxID=611300 RepID=A0ABS5IGL6_9PROT|nr:hypothetical protein [Magnetospirillum sulfuroxidans]MBR9973566.1 hypothetical protein [Magnetospirillum sulfuroxidans]